MFNIFLFLPLNEQLVSLCGQVSIFPTGNSIDLLVPKAVTRMFLVLHTLCDWFHLATQTTHQSVKEYKFPLVTSAFRGVASCSKAFVSDALIHPFISSLLEATSPFINF